MGDAAPRTEEHVLMIISFPEPKEILDQLRSHHPHVKFTYRAQNFVNGQVMNPQELPDEIYKDVTILVTLTTLPKNLDLAPKLKLVHLVSAGVDRLQHTPLWEHEDITITNSSGVHGPQIAEWVIMQILSNAHKEKLMLDFQRRHHWAQHSEIGVISDAVGQRLGVLGYGAIGRQAARIAKAIGYDVIAYTATPKDTPEKKKDTGYIVPGTGDPDGLVPSAWYSGLDKPSLHNFLSQDIDVLLVAVPLTAETTHFIAAPELKILSKKRAFIANIARGKVLQQDDLITALKSDALRGAALDVTDPEPLPADSVLWDLENVAVTPHVSGLGTTYAERTLGILDINLERLEKGQRLLNVVDRKKGY